MKEHRAFVIVLLILISSLTTYGQKVTFPNHRVGFTPTSFVNIFPAIQFNTDFAIRPKINFSCEAGYVFNSETDAMGFRLRPGIEFFLARGESFAITYGMHINFRYTGEYRTVFEETRSNQFTRIYYNNRRDRYFYGPALSMNLFFKLSSRWYLEIGGGAGFGSYQVIDKSALQENQRVDFRESLFTPNTTFDLFPLFYPHLNLSYSISKSESKKKE